MFNKWNLTKKIDFVTLTVTYTANYNFGLSRSSLGYQCFTNTYCLYIDYHCTEILCLESMIYYKLHDISCFSLRIMESSDNSELLLCRSESIHAVTSNAAKEGFLPYYSNSTWLLRYNNHTELILEWRWLTFSHYIDFDTKFRCSNFLCLNWSFCRICLVNKLNTFVTTLLLSPRAIDIYQKYFGVTWILSKICLFAAVLLRRGLYMVVYDRTFKDTLYQTTYA